MNLLSAQSYLNIVGRRQLTKIYAMQSWPIPTERLAKAALRAKAAEEGGLQGTNKIK